MNNRIEYAFAPDPNNASPVPVSGNLQKFPAAIPAGQ
jgi:hypothetical protein